MIRNRLGGIAPVYLFPSAYQLCDTCALQASTKHKQEPDLTVSPGNGDLEAVSLGYKFLCLVRHGRAYFRGAKLQGNTRAHHLVDSDQTKVHLYRHLRRHIIPFVIVECICVSTNTFYH